MNTAERTEEDKMRITESQLRRLIREEILKEEFLKEDAIGVVLDLAGLIPGVGEVADAINAVRHATKGEYLMAALSLISFIPTLGDAIGKGGKLALWVTKYGGKAGLKAGQAAVEYGPKIKQLKKLIANSKSLIDTVLKEAEKNPSLKEHVPKIKDALNSFVSEEVESGGVEKTEGRSFSTRSNVHENRKVKLLTNRDNLK